MAKNHFDAQLDRPHVGVVDNGQLSLNALRCGVDTCCCEHGLTVKMPRTAAPHAHRQPQPLAGRLRPPKRVDARLAR